MYGLDLGLGGPGLGLVTRDVVNVTAWHHDWRTQ